MITFNQTPTRDKNIIWVIRIYFDDVTLNLAYRRSITLSGNLYDANVIPYGSLDLSDKSINPNFGGIGNLSTMAFAIIRNSSNSNVDNFINDFYPANSGRYAVSRIVKIGCVWDNATTEAEITWIGSDYFIYSFANDRNNIYIKCIETSDLEGRSIPYYKIQKDYDDGISYTTKSRKTEGVCIPVSYGEFNIAALNRYWSQKLIKLAPAVLFDESTLEYAFESRICEYVSKLPIIDDDSIIFYKNGGWLVIYPSNTPTANTLIRESVYLQDSKSTNEQLLGSFFLTTNYIPGYKSEIGDISAINANDEGQYDNSITLADTKTISLKIDVPLSDLGLPGSSASDITWTIRGEVEDTGEEVYLSVAIYNQNKSGGAGFSTPEVFHLTDTTPGYVDYEMGDDTSGKKDTALPWTFDELVDVELSITNVSSTYGVARNFVFYGLVLSVNNIIVKQIKPADYKKEILPGLRSINRQDIEISRIINAQ